MYQLVFVINKALLIDTIESKFDILAVKDIMRVIKHIGALIRLLTDVISSMIAPCHTLGGARSAQLVNWYQYVCRLMIL